VPRHDRGGDGGVRSGPWHAAASRAGVAPLRPGRYLCCVPVREEAPYASRSGSSNRLCRIDLRRELDDPAPRHKPRARGGSGRSGRFRADGTRWRLRRRHRPDAPRHRPDQARTHRGGRGDRGRRGLSYFVSPAFVAAASAAAFLSSELADFAVYTPLERRSWLGAVALSNTVGLVIDSVLFLWIAFGSLEFLPGQVVGKAWMTLLALGLLAVIRPRLKTATA
jgi:hypothetical protein